MERNARLRIYLRSLSGNSKTTGEKIRETPEEIAASDTYSYNKQ